jgi:hypothetical protein
VTLALQASARVLRPGGRVCVQMGNTWGPRSLFHQVRRGFRPARGFDVRYWRPAELTRAFAAWVGPATLAADGFFSLNAQPAERPLLPRRFRWIVTVSDAARRASERCRWLTRIADSVFVEASKCQAGA